MTCYTVHVLPDKVSKMANLTLSLDDGVLQRARATALQANTSVNAVVREFLIRYADNRERRLKALDALDAVAARNPSHSKEKWSRDELHQR